MSPRDQSEATAADIDRTSMLLEHMICRTEKMKEELGMIPIEDAQRGDNIRQTIDKKLDWIINKYDELIVKEMELLECNGHGAVQRAELSIRASREV